MKGGWPEPNLVPGAGLAPVQGSPRAAWAGWLAHGAIILICIVVPAAMTVINRSAPLLLCLSALAAVGSALVAGKGNALINRAGGVAWTGAGASAALLAVIALASLAWTIDPAITRRGVSEALPELLAGWALAAAMPLVARSRDFRALLIGLLLGASLILLEATAGMPLHHLIRVRAEPYDLKRGAVVLALLLWPAVAACPPPRRGLWIAALFAAVSTAAVMAGSATGIVAIGTSILIYAAARQWPRGALVCVVVLLVTLVVVTPWAGEIVDMVFSSWMRDAFSAQHASHRIAIWTEFERHIPDRPWLGHGFNASFRLSNLMDAQDPAKALIENIHPHNVLLQVWVELGLVGALGAVGGIVALGWRLRVTSAPDRAFRLALLTSVCAVGLLGLNAWAAWWLAVAVICLTVFGMRQEGADTPAAGS